MKLLNAFSLQMLESFPASVNFSEVSELPKGLESAVDFNRVNVSLKPGEVFYIAQLQGGRLPEGSTTLPPGFSFKFLKGEVR